jgi:hypothetical protein
LTTITIERIGQPPFIVHLGDEVAAWFTHGKFENGTVAGISHASKRIRVKFPGSVQGKGIWFELGQIYPKGEV